MPLALRPDAPDNTPRRAPAAVPSLHPNAAVFRRDVEGLRALAVLLVVAFHAHVPGVQGGFVGVDIFFVLSGYLITGLLVREIEEHGRLDLANFYARRARRLLPGAALMMGVTIVAVAWLLSPLEQLSVSAAARAASMYVSNVWFMWRVGDYMGVGAEANPFLHTWSLAVEEQFYLVWPVAVWMMFRARSRARLAAWIAVLSLASLAFCLWLTAVRQPWAFYASPARGWEFGVGGLAALIPAAWLAERRRARAALAWVGTAAIAIAVVAFSRATQFPGAFAAVPALGTAAVLVSGTAAPGVLQRLLHRPVLQQLGRLSYSWYLWHWPALALAAVLVPGLGVAGRVLVALGSLAVAALAYAVVENPIRVQPWLAVRPRVTLGLAAGLTCVSLALVTGWVHAAERRSLAPLVRAYTNAAAEGPQYDCMVPMMADQGPPCVRGNLESGTTVVLFGDSHADQWQPALQRIAELRGWRLVTLAKPNCPAADVEVLNTRLRRLYHECTRWRGHALERIRQLRPAAVVLASAQGYALNPEVNGVSMAQWREGTRRTATALNSLGIRTVLLHDTPNPSQNMPVCLSRAAHRGRDPAPACNLARDAAVDGGIRREERAALRGLRHASTIDPSGWLCTGPICEPVRDGKVVYRDGNHIAATFALHMVPELMLRLIDVVEPPERSGDATGSAE